MPVTDSPPPLDTVTVSCITVMVSPKITALSPPFIQKSVSIAAVPPLQRQFVESAKPSIVANCVWKRAIVICSGFVISSANCIAPDFRTRIVYGASMSLNGVPFFLIRIPENDLLSILVFTAQISQVSPAYWPHRHSNVNTCALAEKDKSKNRNSILYALIFENCLSGRTNPPR